MKRYIFIFIFVILMFSSSIAHAESEEISTIAELKVSIETRNYPTNFYHPYKYPGETALQVVGSRGYTISWETTSHLAYVGEFEVLHVPWSCKHPERIYYTAKAELNKQVVREWKGSFKTLNKHKCKVLKNQERMVPIEERLNREREHQEKVEQEYIHLWQFEKNCRAIGGTPVTISVSGNNERVCRSQSGGLINVPS